MKNKDLQTLDLLKGEFEKSVDSAKIPLKLQKQSVVHMLEKEAEKQKIQEEEAAKKKYQVVTIRKLMAIAAMLAVVVAGTLVMRPGTPLVALNITSHESGSILNSGESYGKIFEDIVLKPESPSVRPSVTAMQKPSVTDNTNPLAQTSAASTSIPSSPEKEDAFEGYVYKEPEAKLEEQLHTSSPDGVSRFGDFEADTVIEDGDYLYVLTSGRDNETNKTREVILVVKIIPDNDMQVVSEIPVSDGESNEKIDECVEIYLQKNCLITVNKSRSFSTVDGVHFESDVTAASYYDISNPENPVKIHEHIQDGCYVSSRLCDGKLYLVTSTSFSEVTEKADAERIIPGSKINGEYGRVSAENIFYDNLSAYAKTFIYVTVTNVSAPSKSAQFAFHAGGKDVYCHADSIVFSKNFVRTNEVTGAAEDCTFVYRFNVKGDRISYANAVAEINGKIVGGLYADERNGNLKTVTVSDGGYNVYVHDKEMKCVDTVEDLLVGETVKTVKYIGNRVYLVYGENGEKTSIIDFSKKLKAENIVSVSTATLSNSLYEVTETVLLGVGIRNGEDSGKSNAVITLFDFSNPEDFRSTDTLELSEEYVLAAGNDSRCVMVDSEKQIFGIPVIKADSQSHTDVSSYLIFSIEGGKIMQVGECIHDDAVVGDAAVRCVSTDDTVYTVSGKKIVSHSAEDYKAISKVEF